MRLTTKGRYAVTAMLDLAIHQDAESVTLREIAEKQKISLSYLEQLFAKLRKHELVHGTRGPGGGYRLAKDVNDISIAEIIFAVDEPMEFTDCGGKQNCREGEQCLSHDLWMSLTEQLEQFLANIYLGALMQECTAKKAAQAALTTNQAHVVAPTLP